MVCPIGSTENFSKKRPPLPLFERGHHVLRHTRMDSWVQCTMLRGIWAKELYFSILDKNLEMWNSKNFLETISYQTFRRIHIDTEL